MIMGIDYTVRGDLGGECLPVELLSGPWKGVILTFPTVEIREIPNGTARIRWTIDIVDPKLFKKKKLLTDSLFKEHTGLILNAMILSMVDDGETPDFSEYNDNKLD